MVVKSNKSLSPKMEEESTIHLKFIRDGEVIMER